MIAVLEPPVIRARSDPSSQFKSQTSRTTQENADYVPPNAQETSDRAHLLILDGNEVVMKYENQRQEPAHAPCFTDVSCEHELVFSKKKKKESIWTQHISMTYVHTKQQIADILTKSSFTRERWNELMILLGVLFLSLFNAIVVSQATPILAESLVATLTKFVGSSRLSRFVVAGILSLIPAAHFQWLPLWFCLLRRLRREAVR